MHRQLRRLRHSISLQPSRAVRPAVSCRRGVACTAQALPDRDRRPAQVAERTERDVALESMQLESELREKVSGAVENLGYRVRGPQALHCMLAMLLIPVIVYPGPCEQHWQ